MARPNKGLGHVDSQPGDPQSKRRLCGILSTTGGQQSVDEVCKELGIRPTYFAELRGRALRGALAALAPRPVGRPPRRPATSESEVMVLRQRIAELERENQILHARLDLAQVTTLEVHGSKSAASRTASWAQRARSPASG